MFAFVLVLTSALAFVAAERPSPQRIEFGPFVWRVLYERDGKKLIITEDIVSVMRANFPTWEESDIRRILNGTFLQNFTPEEKERIAETFVMNNDNLWIPYPYALGGNHTVDKVFLLSVEEADRYFGDSGQYLRMRGWRFTENPPVGYERVSGGTKLSNRHDRSRVALYNGSPRSWWLRSTGNSMLFTNNTFVRESGEIQVSGALTIGVAMQSGGIRPAMWIYVQDAED